MIGVACLALVVCGVLPCLVGVCRGSHSTASRGSWH